MPKVRWLDFPVGKPNLVPAQYQIRRSAVLLYGVGIVSSQLAAHTGAIQVDHLRLFELLGLLSIAAMALTWRMPEERFSTRFLTAMSITGTILIACGVALSGGGDSPLRLFYLFPVIFNAFLFRNRIVWTFLPAIVLVSVLPAWVEQQNERLMVQLLIVAPIYLATTVCVQTLLKGLRQVSSMLVSVADTQARLEEAERWNEQLDTVHTVAQQITRVTSVSELADAIIEHTRRAIPYHSARVYIREGEKLLPIAFRGSEEYAFQSWNTLDLNVGEGLTGWVARHATSLHIDDVHSDPRTLMIPESHITEESMLLSPLIQADQSIGVIVLVRLGRFQFSHRELKLLDIIAGQASNAVSKAWNLDAAHRQARTDGLTGLLNHRAMAEQLALHLDRGQMQQYPVSIAMLDANHFKHINDNHGHLAGDKVLQKIAYMLISYCRTTDLVVRYGGDEFLLILPETDAVTAARVVRRIISTISAQHVFLSSEGGESVSIRLSSGMATSPLDGSTVRDLLAVADSRLYVAKGFGKHDIVPNIRPDFKASQPHRDA
jgi:diguanylate cyclase (GGDEF)-like protein